MHLLRKFFCTSVFGLLLFHGDVFGAECTFSVPSANMVITSFNVECPGGVANGYGEVVVENSVANGMPAVRISAQFVQGAPSGRGTIQAEDKSFGFEGEIRNWRPHNGKGYERRLGGEAKAVEFREGAIFRSNESVSPTGNQFTPPQKATSEQTEINPLAKAIFGGIFAALRNSLQGAQQTGASPTVGTQQAVANPSLAQQEQAANDLVKRQAAEADARNASQARAADAQSKANIAAADAQIRAQRQTEEALIKAQQEASDRQLREQNILLAKQAADAQARATQQAVEQQARINQQAKDADALAKRQAQAADVQMAEQARKADVQRRAQEQNVAPSNTQQQATVPQTQAFSSQAQADSYRKQQEAQTAAFNKQAEQERLRYQQQAEAERLRYQQQATAQQAQSSTVSPSNSGGTLYRPATNPLPQITYGRSTTTAAISPSTVPDGSKNDSAANAHSSPTNSSANVPSGILLVPAGTSQTANSTPQYLTPPTTTVAKKSNIVSPNIAFDTANSTPQQVAPSDGLAIEASLIPLVPFFLEEASIATAVAAEKWYAESGNTVYVIRLAQKIVYVGITSNFSQRAAYWLSRGYKIIPVAGLTNVSRLAAHGIEQLYIARFGLARESGQLLNKYNSIAADNPSMANALKLGIEALRAANWPGF
ncbi:hypothetical protein [Rhodoferax sp. GW822-FHT02A01]|uniref:hypothetical protein n=1 Tax=Rhodoferax sp. GW822-FHT02A01 TaxID=3141537 RepID=UPI00315C7156